MPRQVLQLRAQIFAFRLLSRNLAVPDDLQRAISGELSEVKTKTYENLCLTSAPRRRT